MEHTVTHFVDLEPSNFGLREISFITTKDENYYYGFEQKIPIDALFLQKNEEENFFVRLLVPQKMMENQSIWIGQNGDVFIASADKSFEENGRIYLRKSKD